MQKSIYPLPKETEQSALSVHDRILSQKDLQNILPFKRTKIQQLLNSNQLPVLKVGKDYITTFSILENWIKDHLGNEIYY